MSGSLNRARKRTDNPACPQGLCSQPREAVFQRTFSPFGFGPASSPADHSEIQAQPQQGPGHLRFYTYRFNFTPVHFPQALPTRLKSIFPAWPSTMTLAFLLRISSERAEGGSPENTHITQQLSLSCTFT